VTILSYYRLRMPSSGLQKGVTHPIAISIPAGAILKVPTKIEAAVGLIDVEWDGENVQVFAVDLRDRAELLRRMSAGASAR
jgi:hypothetical protein